MGLIPGLTQGAKDPALLWLWCRPAAATLIQLLVQEPPYAMRVALKKKKKNIMEITDNTFQNSKEINKFPRKKNVFTKIKSRRTHLGVPIVAQWVKNPT